MISDVENVRNVLSSFTKAPFRVTDPESDRLRLRENATWEVACLDLAYAEQTAHLDKAWKDKDGLIWFETTDIADMIGLVEREYGEKGVTRMPDAEVGVPPPQTVPKEVAGFPRVVRVLERYEKIVADINKMRGVSLRLLYDGGAGLTTVRIAIPATNFNEYGWSDTQITVESVSKILKEAYEAVLAVKS